MKFFKPLFVFDLRSLSLLRIGIALTLFTDLFIRLSNLEAHYTDRGILPLEALFRFAWNTHYFSLYTMSGASLFQFILFLLNFICIAALLVGYRTKVFTLACWIFLISLHNRNPLIHQAGDDLLRLMLFWGIFLPWNLYYSIDAKKFTHKPNPSSGFLLAGFAYMLQVGFVYFFSALLKTSSEWTSEFSAVYYALSIDQIVLPAGRWIYPFEEVLRFLTMGIYYTEFLIPFVLLIPFFTSYFRAGFICIICMLHIGIALCLNVGLFPLIGIVSLIGLLPGEVSQRVEKTVTSFNIPVFIKRRYSGLWEEDKKNIPKENVLKKILVVFFFIYVLNWNLLTIQAPNLISYIGTSPAYLFRIHQQWGMFSPGVFKADGWFIFSAITNDGRDIDLLREGDAVTYQKKASVLGPFKQDRWRKFSENMLRTSNAHLRKYYCFYLLNQWNNKHQLNGERIYSLEMIYMKEISLPGYQVEGPSKEILCSCSIKKE